MRPSNFASEPHGQKSLGEKITEGMKNIDCYGSKVSLNLNGKTTHNTLPGCAWTIFFYLSLTFFTVYYLYRWMLSVEFIMMTSTVYNSDFQPICFECLEYTFSFNIKDSVNNKFIKPSSVLPYFDFELRHESWKYDQVGNIEPVFTTLNLNPCSDAYRNSTEIKGEAVFGSNVEIAFDKEYAWCFKLPHPNTNLSPGD
jgi:hypothetical protein